MSLNSSQMQIFINIIGAVESGGQIYGNRNYGAYAPAYANTSNEHTCTLGWAQNYGDEARKLCKNIFAKDKEAFRKADTANIEAKLNTDWVANRWNPNSSEKKALIAIITTKAGKECQDELFAELTNTYIKSAMSYDSSMSVQAQMMWCEIEHLGGLSAVKRIFNRASKPYTVDSVFNSLMLDQKDTSSSNQVGDKKFQSRHECCVKWIKQYVTTDGGSSKKEEKKDGGDNKMTKEKAIKAMINVATEEIGYLEKKSNSQLDSKTANAGSNNYTKYWRDVYPEYQGQPWCACFVSWVFMKTFGLATAKKLLKHWPYVYCPTLGELFTKNANPKVGDIVIFYRNGTFAHTGIVIAVNGDQFTTIEGNTSGGSSIIANGGGVCKKSYYNSNLPGTKFCTPDYSIVTKTSGGDTPSPAPAPSGGEKKATAYADVFDKSIAGTYKTTENLYMRNDADRNSPEMVIMPKNTKCQCYGYYSVAPDKNPWYYVQCVLNGVTYTGFASSRYLKKV